MWKTQPSKTVVRKGCPEIFSLSRASQISRQYLLFRTIVVGCTPVSLSTSLCLIVSQAFFVNMCRPTRETFQGFCRGWTNSPNRGCGCARIRQMYIIVYIVKMVSFLSVMFANSSAIAPRSLEWLYDSGKLATLTLTTHLGQNVGSFLTWMIPSLLTIRSWNWSPDWQLVGWILFLLLSTLTEPLWMSVEKFVFKVGKALLVNVSYSFLL